MKTDQPDILTAKNQESTLDYTSAICILKATTYIMFNLLK